MSFENTKNRAIRMLDRRDYGRDELIDKLIQKGEDPADSESAADYLVELGLVDDARYAALLVRHYAQKGYGRSRVKTELYRRKIPKTLWDEALCEMPEQDDIIDRLLKSKLRGDVNDRAALKKATDALSRRGFSWSEIKSAIERLRAESEFDTDEAFFE